MKHPFSRALKANTTDLCECGGSGPDDGCLACQLYHRLYELFWVMEDAREATKETEAK